MGIVFYLGNVVVRKFRVSAAFTIGHEKIDSDHAELIDMLNDMIDAVVANDLHSMEGKGQAFHERLKRHFIEEENIMKGFGFVDKNHFQLYNDVLVKIQQKCESCKSIEDWQDCILEMGGNLMSWVLKNDLKFAEHLVTMGYNKS